MKLKFVSIKRRKDSRKENTKFSPPAERIVGELLFELRTHTKGVIGLYRI